MKITNALLMGLMMAVAATAQTAIKIDEFENLNCDEYLGRMDVTFAEASKDKSSSLLMLIYEGKEPEYNAGKNRIEIVSSKFGSAEAKFRSIKKYMSYRKFPVKRASFINGGFRERMTVEIWLIPSGAPLPKLSPTLTRMRYRKGGARGFCTDCC